MSKITAEPRTIHMAAEPIGDVQNCARCGKVLIDNTEIAAKNPAAPSWMVAFFPVGTKVAEYGGRMQTLVGAGVVMVAGVHTMDEMRAYKAERENYRNRWRAPSPAMSGYHCRTAPDFLPCDHTP
jgi:hypothetical protein